MANTSVKFDGVLFEPEPDWSGYTTKTHLARRRMITPKWASDVMEYIGTRNRSAMTMETYLKQTAKVVEDDTDDPINIMVYGDEKRFSTLMGYTSLDRSRTGLGKRPFVLTFDTPYFSKTNSIVGYDDKYQIRVMSNPIPNGSYFDYECILMGGVS